MILSACRIPIQIEHKRHQQAGGVSALPIAWGLGEGVFSEPLAGAAISRRVVLVSLDRSVGPKETTVPDPASSPDVAVLCTLPFRLQDRKEKEDKQLDEK